MTKFKIGDKVTTNTRVEALYSGMYKGTSSAYPEQFFEPGMQGVVIFTDSPSVRRNIDQYVVEFEGILHGSEEHPYTKWRVRLDPKFVKSV